MLETGRAGPRPSQMRRWSGRGPAAPLGRGVGATLELSGGHRWRASRPPSSALCVTSPNPGDRPLVRVVGEEDVERVERAEGLGSGRRHGRPASCPRAWPQPTARLGFPPRMPSEAHEQRRTLTCGPGGPRDTHVRPRRWARAPGGGANGAAHPLGRPARRGPKQLPHGRGALLKRVVARFLSVAGARAGPHLAPVPETRPVDTLAPRLHVDTGAQVRATSGRRGAAAAAGEEATEEPHPQSSPGSG